MRLNSRMRFAVAALIEVALNHPHGPVSLSKISIRHQISMTHLEKIFSKLLAHELVLSARGPGGGYTLACEPHEINLLDISQALEDKSVNDLKLLSASAESEIWADLQRSLDAQMQSINLSQMLAEQKITDSIFIL
jgi:Rrf2 family transcriptional regulator, iron-sulfur cluster assembly transcription factor